MNRRLLAISALTIAVGLALAMQAPSFAPRAWPIRRRS